MTKQAQTTMGAADAHGRTRPSARALAAANAIADQFNVGFCSDAMVLDFADIIDSAYGAFVGSVESLLASAPAHITPRNAREREAYKALRTDIGEVTRGKHD